ncbi:hypothetical protein PFUGPA_04304 [Plasmodium falciparum Palo Alto/Uganda]|uniref:Plasmodium RESA N-terminal domain-containing protein n=2 Tax=Plasmodium falciparum TaxID=5833 RepID=W4IWR6_PLAFP|nr:hypothetical protein PFUGPA_04304 [Plasmodium falciparum Palo Alto/Uganda]ETW58756.1 hypothetical protein PFMC_05849 [Plasmodium falciparum CAMP/Malaysia]
MCIRYINIIKIMKNININENSVFCYRKYYRKCNEIMNNSFNVKCDLRENEKLNKNKFPRLLVSYFYVLSIVGIIYCLLFNIHTHGNKDEGLVSTLCIDSRCLSEGYLNLYSPLCSNNPYFSFREILHGSNYYIPKEFMEWDDEEEKNGFQFDEDDEEDEEDDGDDDDDDDYDDEDEEEEDMKKKNYKNVPTKIDVKKPNNTNKVCDNKNSHIKNNTQQEEKNKNTTNQKSDANNKIHENKKKVEEEEKHKKEKNPNEKENNDNNKNKNEKKNGKGNQGNNKDLPAYKTIDYNNLSVQISLEDFQAILNSLDSVLSAKEMHNLWNQLRGIERFLFEDTVSDLFTVYHDLLETYNLTAKETEHIWKNCLSDARHSQSYAETQCNVDHNNFIRKKNLTQEAYKNYLTQSREKFSKLRDEIHDKGETYLNEQITKYRKAKYNNLDQASKKKKKENEKEKERKRKEKEQEKEKEKQRKQKEQEKERKRKEKEQEKERKNKENKKKETKNKIKTWK